MVAEPSGEVFTCIGAKILRYQTGRAVLRMTMVLDGSRSPGNGGILAVCRRSIRELTLRNERTIVRIRLGWGEWRMHAAWDVEDAVPYVLYLR